MKDITKDYRLGETAVHALKGIDLEIDSEEFVAVLGPSGSGKTTLLNLVGFIDRPTSGVLRFQDQEILTLSDDQQSELRNHSIGFIFQQFNLIPVLSAVENIMIPLQIMGISGAEAKTSALQRLEQVELSDFARQRPDKLSGGQRQRVAIARSLVTNPNLIIADEPTANLDSETAMKIIDLMRVLNRKEGTTFIFSTHDERLLDNVDRLIHLVDGRIAID